MQRQNPSCPTPADDTRPRLLDLFCAGGLASDGYVAAGFDVVGVDLLAQPEYPHAFVQADALDVLGDAAFLAGFDVIHASPPCQGFSRARHLRTAQGGTCSALDLVAPVREGLVAAGKPWVIENVEGAPIEGVTLCGSSFGLGVRRHRVFESSELLMGLPCRHKAQGRPVGVYHVLADEVPNGGRTARTVEEGREAMGTARPISWGALKLGLPPAYCEHLGRQLMASLLEAA